MFLSTRALLQARAFKSAFLRVTASSVLICLGRVNLSPRFNSTKVWPRGIGSYEMADPLPARKRRKVSNQGDDDADIEGCGNHTQGPCCRPRPILAEDYTTEIETVQAYVAEIRDPKQTSTLIKALDEASLLGDVKHLKRIKKMGPGKDSGLNILLCLETAVRASGHTDAAALLAAQGVGPDLIGEVQCVSVPGRAPLTRPQYEAASKLWPVPFHEDKKIRHALEGRLFTKDQLQVLHAHMQQALAIGQQATKEARIANPETPPLAGAVLIDPHTGRILASAADSPSHPLHHATMQCVAMVADSQRKAQEEAGGPSKDQPYLCGGYDLFITKEPCIMCAMGLVHSRIGHVFYGVGDSDMGGLGGRFRINAHKSINHSFEVFSDVCLSACREHHSCG